MFNSYQWPLLAFIRRSRCLSNAEYVLWLWTCSHQFCFQSQVRVLRTVSHGFFPASISSSISYALLHAVDKLLIPSLLVIFGLFQFVPLLHPLNVKLFQHALVLLFINNSCHAPWKRLKWRWPDDFSLPLLPLPKCILISTFVKM